MIGYMNIFRHIRYELFSYTYSQKNNNITVFRVFMVYFSGFMKG